MENLERKKNANYRCEGVAMDRQICFLQPTELVGSVKQWSDTSHDGRSKEKEDSTETVFPNFHS